jgi:hypothetical protein
MVKLFLLLMFLAFPVHADDVQWSKGFTANCIDATERADGTLLALSEIGSIKYSIFPDGEIVNPEHVHVSGGPCRSTFIDTKQFSVGVKDIYMTTIDTDGRESVFSTVKTHTIIKANPKPPKSWL